MAKLNFPDPSSSTTYTEAGITWTWNNTYKVWSSDIADVGSSSSVFVGSVPPVGAEEGDLWWNSSDSSGRLYVYYKDANSSQWVEASPQGDVFSGDYNDLNNKPNIPPEFNLDDGSYENDIIHWADLGSVQEISTTDVGQTNSGNSYSNVSAAGGSGSGLICNVIRRRYTGVHEVYIAVRGKDYIAGETVFLDLGYDPTGSTGSTGINCTIDQVNEENDGWIARPGKDYYISSIEDSTNTGVPQFMTGAVFGGKESDLAGRSTESSLNIYSLGSKDNNVINYYANSNVNNYCNISGNNPTLSFTLRGEMGTDVNYSRFNIEKTSYSFTIADPSGGYNRVGTMYKDSLNEGTLAIYANDSSNSNRVTLGTKNLISKVGSGNSAFNFESSNAKFNFKKTDGTTGYVINAGNGSAGFALPEDVALASNYDAEGEYIGPIQDRVADLIARVNAIESNEISDDSVDSALLTLVASLTTRLDERDVTIAALTTRIAALEGA